MTSPKKTKPKTTLHDLGLWVKNLWPQSVSSVGVLLGHSSFPCFPAISGWFKIHISYKGIVIIMRNPTVMRVSPVSMVSTNMGEM